MFVRSYDLRMVLFILLLLPLLGALFTLLVVRLRARRQQSLNLSRQLDLHMTNAPCGFIAILLPLLLPLLAIFLPNVHEGQAEAYSTASFGSPCHNPA